MTTTAGAILLVEDNEDDVFLMKRALAAASISNPLFVVEDGEQALQYMEGVAPFNREEHPLPVIIFLDLKLPIKRGLDVLAWIRSREQFAQIVVVVLTSSNEASDLREAYRLGANSYLVKPPTAAQLTDLAKAFKWYWLEYNQYKT